MPELTKKSPCIDKYTRRQSIRFLDIKIRTPHKDDGILILQKLTLKLMSKGPGLQSNIENS